MDDFDGMILPTLEPRDEWEGLVQPPEPRRRGLVAVWAGMVGLVGSVVFAFLFLAGNRADTPEQAVERLFEAVSNEDVLGILEALPPSERDAMKDHVSGLAAELKRLDVLAADLDLSKISGLDLAIEDVRLSATSLGEGVSAVRVEGGTGSWAVTPDQLPLGDLVRDFLGDDLPSQTISDREPLTPDGPERLVAIREGGGWYVSVWYSAAEAIREESGAPAPDFGRGLRARGEASPEAALRAMAEAGLGLDARRVMELLPPDEARALHDYAPLFLDQAERAAAEARDDVSLRLDELETSVRRDGDRAHVTIESFAVSGTIDGEHGGVRFDGTCIELFGEDGDDERICADDLSGITGLSNGFFGWGNTSVVAVERDGEWFVSPTRSILEGMVEGLRQLERRDLESLADGFGGWFGGGLPEGLLGDGADGDGDRVVDHHPDFFGGEVEGGGPAAPLEDDAEAVEPEPALGGYTFEEFLELPPDEQARVLAEIQQGQGGKGQVPGRRP